MSENQQEIDPQNLNEQIFSYKIDRMYYNSLKILVKKCVNYLLIHLGKCLYLTAFIIFYFHDRVVTPNGFFPPLITAAFLSLVLALANVVLITSTKNLAKNLVIAKDLNHIVQEPYDPNLRFDIFEDSISNIYDATNPEQVEQLPLLESIQSDVIKHYYMVINKDLNITAKISEASLFAISIWLIVLINTQPIEQKQRVIIIIYIILQLLVAWKLVLVCAVIALSPIIIGIFCCCIICCRPKKKTDFIDRLNPIDYRESIQLPHGVDCMICFTSFYPDQKICILQCPAKHAFHQICIKAWFQVGSTCPACRHDFANDQ